MTWTETQVRFIILGLLLTWPDLAEGVSVNQSLIDVGGKIDETTYSRISVCASLDISEEEAEEYMFAGGWDVEG